MAARSPIIRDKILYGAGNRNGAKLQLTRLLEHLDPDQYIIKLAGYKRMGLYLDWTLDALLDPFDPDHISLDNDNFEILFEQIKNFNPDLIISDLDVFTSYAGQLLDKQVWQVSPSLLQYAELSSSIGINTKYAVLRQRPDYEKQLIQNILINSQHNYIYSPFGDLGAPIKLPDNFEWMRPYYYIGQTSPACQHDIVSTATSKKALTWLNKHSDVVVFADQQLSTGPNITIKDMANSDEYACNVKNCTHYISDGLTDTIADAIYNQKRPIIMPNVYDIECITNTLLMEHHKLATISYHGLIDPNMSKEVKLMPQSNIAFLHEKIDQFRNV